MKTSKKIGVWLDHSKAYLLEPNQTANDIKTIESTQIGNYREAGESSNVTSFGSSSGKGYHASNNEYNTNRIEEGELKSFYGKLQDQLEGYDEIILMGPTTAKKELLHLMEKNKKFHQSTIKLQSQDKLTPNQFAALVQSEFNQS